VIVLAHNCAVLKVPFDTSRLFGEPHGDYALALELITDAVASTNRQAEERAKHG
jgi:hypothetical protein